MLKQYFNHIDLRPTIRASAFDNKKTLLIGLAQYVEEHPLTKDDALSVTEILKTIPKRVFYDMKGTLAPLKIYDYYYAIPPNERHPKEPRDDSSASVL